jgi:hypothetical protein
MDYVSILPVSRSLTAANAQNRPRNLGKEEAQAHIGLSSHGYYYHYVCILLCRLDSLTRA